MWARFLRTIYKNQMAFPIHTFTAIAVFVCVFLFTYVAVRKIVRVSDLLMDAATAASVSLALYRLESHLPSSERNDRFFLRLPLYAMIFVGTTVLFAKKTPTGTDKRTALRTRTTHEAVHSKRQLQHMKMRFEQEMASIRSDVEETKLLAALATAIQQAPSGPALGSVHAFIDAWGEDALQTPRDDVVVGEARYGHPLRR